MFTVPAIYRTRIGLAEAVRLRAASVAVLEAWTDAWTGTKRGYIASFHPEGDSNPGTWAPHVHVASPCVGRAANGDVVELHEGRKGLEPKGYVPSDELADLKARWGAVLDGIAASTGLPRQTVNVYYRSASVVEEVEHHLAYNARPFPAWNAGSLRGHTLSKTLEYGMAAPNATDKAEYRRVVAGQSLPRIAKPCPCCQGELVPSRHYPGAVLVGSPRHLTLMALQTPLLDADTDDWRPTGGQMAEADARPAWLPGWDELGEPLPYL